MFEPIERISKISLSDSSFHFNFSSSILSVIRALNHHSTIYPSMCISSEDEERERVFAYISSNYWLHFKKLRRYRCCFGKVFSVVTLSPGRTAVPVGHTRRETRREKLSRDHEIFIPLKSLSVVTINNHESRNNVPPGSTTVSFVSASFFLSLSLSLCPSVVDVSLPR